MLHRFTTYRDAVAVTDAIATCEEIRYGEYTSGEVFVPTGSSLTSLTFWAAPEPGGTYLPAQDYDGVAVVLTVAQTKCYPIPLCLIGCRALKIVGNTSGTLDVSLKS